MVITSPRAGAKDDQEEDEDEASIEDRIADELYENASLASSQGMVEIATDIPEPLVPEPMSVPQPPFTGLQLLMNQEVEDAEPLLLTGVSSVSGGAPRPLSGKGGGNQGITLRGP